MRQMRRQVLNLLQMLLHLRLQLYRQLQLPAPEAGSLVFGAAVAPPLPPLSGATRNQSGLQLLPQLLPQPQLQPLQRLEGVQGPKVVVLVAMLLRLQLPFLSLQRDAAAAARAGSLMLPG